MGRPNNGNGSSSNRQRGGGGHNGNGSRGRGGRGSSKGRGSASASTSARSGGGGGGSSSSPSVGLLGAAPPPSGHRHPPSQLLHQWHAPSASASASEGAKRPRPAGLDGGVSGSKQQVVVGLKRPSQPALLVPAGAAAVAAGRQQQQQRGNLTAASPAPASTKRPPTSAQQQQQQRRAAGGGLRGPAGKQQAPATTRAHLNSFNCPKEGDARPGVELGFNFWVHTQTQVGAGDLVWFWVDRGDLGGLWCG